MKFTVFCKKGLCIALSIALILSFTACKKRDSSDAEQDDGVSRAAPQESEPDSEAVENSEALQTYQIPGWGIEFECPESFAGDAESNVISEDSVIFSIDAEDSAILASCSRAAILVSCSRAASLDEWAALAEMAGQDSSALYEEFNSLDVTDASVSCRHSFESFELLNSASAPESYKFYFVGTDPLGNPPAPELGFRYKNHGGFVDSGGVINVEVTATASDTVDRDAFTSLCETVTGSMRLSARDAEDGAPSADVGGSFDAVLEPLEGATYVDQCREIVNNLFHYAPLVCYDGPRLYLERLFGGNKELFHSLEYKDGLLEGERNFSSELSFQACNPIEHAANSYYANVNEVRTYYGDETGSGAYVHTICITINSPEDYCITAVESLLDDPIDLGFLESDGGVDGGYQEPGGGEVSGSFPSIYDDEDGIYDGPPDGVFYTPDGNLNYNLYWPPELEAQRDYGANAQIDDSSFNVVLSYIHMGDVYWFTNAEAVSFGGVPNLNSADYYKLACEYLEQMENMAQYSSQVQYTATPLYELAMYRYLSAVQVWGYA